MIPFTKMAKPLKFNKQLSGYLIKGRASLIQQATRWQQVTKQE